MDVQTMKFSVIIPTLCEEHTLRKCIRQIRNAGANVEIIVVDGGSSDATLAVAREEDVIVRQCESKRGVQCNIGASVASGDVLLFLHADTLLPRDAFTVLKQTFSNGRTRIGTFRVRFDSSHPVLRFYGLFARFDSIFTRFGDQCITVEKSFFHSLNGFPPWPIFEDVRLLERAREQTIIHSFPAQVVTSARKFLARGILKQQIHNGWLILQYLMGKSPEFLAAAYRGNRAHSSLIIFAKEPVAGNVKTRLAQSVGYDFAAEFYKMCAEQIFHQARLLPDSIRREVYVADEKISQDVRKWVPEMFTLRLQSGETLGERMLNAFRRIFSEGASKAVLIGSDIPELTADDLSTAFTALDTVDVVLGPARDGGYYLIGLKSARPELFTDIPWSTASVLDRTLDIASRCNLKVRLLRELEDIDTIDQLLTWSRSSTDSNHPAISFLRKHGIVERMNFHVEVTDGD